MAGGWETAACRGLNPRLFYPGPVSNASIAQAERARAVCDRCPIRALCLDDALTSKGRDAAADRVGIRGGLDGRERYALQRGHRLPRRPLPIPDDGREHGKRPTYRKGCRCFACCAAETSKEPRPVCELAPCGTKAAYRRHVRNGQEIDPECAATQRGRYSSPRLVPEVRPACGTRSGYQWHTERHEIPCPECTAADLAVVWFVRERSAA
ncbi:WhiB family transcriptional regulator (plasmid) [Streptomyces sp. NBC_00873]|uniref:WhiB family transcriptional regulator n=1 Tax=Streptomyces sp. NBC_00873 TaxID=2975852 RepID=UPI00386AD904|nr:WhiB family transcriptional regulator [Streptomyces sp. NBC_00873]